MKKSELVLGNVVKAYKGEKEFQITQINEESVILNGEKEVKVSTLLKNDSLSTHLYFITKHLLRNEETCRNDRRTVGIMLCGW